MGKKPNTKENRLKRIDANLKARMIEDEVARRVSELTSQIAEFMNQGQEKVNEHMITVHRRGELEQLQAWMKENIFEAYTLGTRNPLKVWDILKYGNEGEVYRASNTITSWEGTEVQFNMTLGENPSPVIVFTKLPKIANSRLQIGSIVDLVGAVTQADWVFIGKKDTVKPPARVCLTVMCLELSRTIRLFAKQYISAGNGLHLKARADLELTMKRVFERIDKYPSEFKANTDMLSKSNPLNLDDIKTFADEIGYVSSFIQFMNEDEIVEKCEELIALTYFFYSYWWGVHEWDERIETALTNEQMLEVARGKLEEQNQSKQAI